MKDNDFDISRQFHCKWLWKSVSFCQMFFHSHQPTSAKTSVSSEVVLTLPSGRVRIWKANVFQKLVWSFYSLERIGRSSACFCSTAPLRDSLLWNQFSSKAFTTHDINKWKKAAALFKCIWQTGRELHGKCLRSKAELNLCKADERRCRELPICGYSALAGL